MPSYSRGDVVLIRFPYSDLSGSKVRPCAIVSGPHESTDIVFTPHTSRTNALLTGEFVLSDYRGAGLNVPTAVKRGFYTCERQIILSRVGRLAKLDSAELDRSIGYWLGLAAGP